MFFHLAYLHQATSFYPIWPYAWFGWVGVEIFFVVYGFVIANSASVSTAKNFLRGRILRLYPAVWFCATITLLVRSPEKPLFPYLRSIALVPKGPWISSVYWTLAVEIAFYAVVYALLCVKAFSWISRIALALMIFSSAYLAVAAFQIWPDSDHLNIFLVRHGCFFALGLWIWLSTTRPLEKWERVAVVASTVPCLVEIYLTGTKFLPRQVMGWTWIIVPLMVWIVAISLISFSSKMTSRISLRSAATLRTLGLMTYPLYSVHDEAGTRLVGLAIFIGLNKWIALSIGSLSMIFLSWFVCRFWEPPVRKRLAAIFEQISSVSQRSLRSYLHPPL